MQVVFYFAGEITQVLDAIPWVRCASGNVSLYGVGILRQGLGRFKKIDVYGGQPGFLQTRCKYFVKKKTKPGDRKSDCLPNFHSQDLPDPAIASCETGSSNLQLQEIG